MDKIMRNESFWLKCTCFIHKEIKPSVYKHSPNFRILGYFPYHTARIRRRLHREYITVPISYLESFIDLLEKGKIFDNKAVYICSSDLLYGDIQQWAVMIKDNFAILGSWEEVVDYEGKPLRLIK